MPTQAPLLTPAAVLAIFREAGLRGVATTNVPYPAHTDIVVEAHHGLSIARYGEDGDRGLVALDAARIRDRYQRQIEGLRRVLEGPA